MPSNFVEYLDPGVKLEDRIVLVLEELGVTLEQRDGISAFLQPLKVKDRATYDHSMRVGLLTQKIGKFTHLDARALFYDGIMHDVGKALTSVQTLKRTDVWTAEDA